MIRAGTRAPSEGKRVGEHRASIAVITLTVPMQFSEAGGWGRGM